MTLRLVIENLDRMPDGGPLRVEVKARGLDIGRDAHLDWTLPDPSRYVSGKHCEIRYRDGEYWLHDVSTNGTFVNGAQFRLEAPHRLREGDRLTIGPYIVAVSVEGGKAEPAPAAWGGAPAADAGQASGDVWGAVGDVAPPEDRDAYRVRNRPKTQGDFLDFAADAGFRAPGAESSVWGGAPAAAPPPPAPDEDWLRAPPPAAPPPPPPPDPRELPLVERPRPIRPAEPAAAPPPPPARPAPPPVTRPQSFDPSPFDDEPSPFLAGRTIAPEPAAPPPAPEPPPPPAFEPSPFEAEPLPVVSQVRPAPSARPAPPPLPPETQSRPAPRPAPPPPEPPRPVAVGDAALLARIAASAGLPVSAIAGRDPNEVADEIGKVLRLTVDNLMQLHASRKQTKSAIRSTQHTQIQLAENNPIKFTTDGEHALETMFGPPTHRYIRAPAAVRQVFEDTKMHTMLTFGAMQNALESLFSELAPDRIEASVEPERGLSAMMASRKSKLWDAYAERWRALTKRADGRLNEAFMALFSEAYDRLSEKGGKPE